MQDGAPFTGNNMQAEDENSTPSDPEVNILPGPSILNMRKVIPNSLTLMAVAVGLSGIPLALNSEWGWAIFCILAAGVLDGLDGPVARALNGTSRFGAELDSLCDYINFGVSPAIVLYLWSLRSAGIYGWATCILYVICMGCRLARFNAGVDFNASKVTRNFFMGVPAPAGAMLVIFPMVVERLRESWEKEDGGKSLENFWQNFGDFGPQLKEIFFVWEVPKVMVYMLVVSFLLVSRIPTFSAKMLNRAFFSTLSWGARSVLAMVVLSFALGLIFSPWRTLCLVNVIYVITFPISFFNWKISTLREAKEEKEKKGK